MNEQISKTKQLRKDLDEQLQEMKQLEPCREVSISITKLQESIMWLGMNLKRIGTPNPYPESYNPDNDIVDPTADGMQL